MTLPELFANTPTPGVPGPLAQLSAAAAAADGTIATTGPAPAALQATGQFRILIDGEYMLVTGGAATTSWSVSRGLEGSTAAAHAAGAAVTHLLTAGALTALSDESARYASAGTFTAPQAMQSDTTTPFTATTTPGNNAVCLVVNAYGNGLLVDQTFDHSAANEGARDSLGVYHRSTGDAIFVAHAGGEPPGYTAVAGGDAGLNVLIPRYLDDIGSGWNGQVLNNRTNMKGIFIQAQPNNINVSAAWLESWTNSPCLILTNQDPSHPQGTGGAVYVDDWGGGPVGNPTITLARNPGGGAAQPFLQMTNRTGTRFQAISVGDVSQVRWRIDTLGFLQWVEATGAVLSSLQRSAAGVLGVGGSLAFTPTNGATPRTGLGGVSGDYLTFYTAGAERLRIGPDGALSTGGVSAFTGTGFQISQNAAGLASSLVLQNTHQADGDRVQLAMSDSVRHFAVIQGIFTSSANAGAVSVQVRRGSSLVERLRVDQNGVGLNGVPPVARAPAIPSPASDTTGTKAAIDAIRTALTNLGVTL
jgi:hypothetical protein